MNSKNPVVDLYPAAGECCERADVQASSGVETPPVSLSLTAEDVAVLHGRVRRRRAEVSLVEFTRQAWPIIEPTTEFRDGWHIRMIAEHLEAVYPGNEIRDLIICVPPRHMKSILASVLWPTWVWIQCPSFRWLTASYAGNLAVRDALKSRRILESQWFRSHWDNRFRMTGDQNVKARYENDATGYRIATSVGGGVTGEGGDCLICDDPHNLIEIHSRQSRDTVSRWWDEVMSTRRNDPSSSSRVLIMQRAHTDDLVGRLRGRGYTELILPAEAPRAISMRFPITGDTIDRQAGDILWPEQFDAEAIADTKRNLGSRAASAQLQQEPVPEGGSIIRREWWRYFKQGSEPRFDYVIQSWDTAFKTANASDWSVCTTIGVSDTQGAFVLDRWRARVEFPELKRAAVALFDSAKPVAVWIEDKASGQSLIQELQRETNIPIVAIEVDRDKIARVNAISPVIEAGKVHFPEGVGWAQEIVDEFAAFPDGLHDDQVDSLTQALMKIFLEKRLTPRIRRL